MLDHLNAIDLRLSHERARLAAAEANGFHNVIAWREHNVRMIERERAATYREDYQRGDHYEGYATRAVIEQEAAAHFSALARAAMGIEDSPRRKHERAGQIEAFEFAARQFAVYAADNEEVNNRYGIKGRERKVADKRTQTWRDAADDCERVAAELRRDADG